MLCVDSDARKLPGMNLGRFEGSNAELSYYNGKTVLVTGHTGFKGSWLCRILTMAGAHVVGYSLEPPTEPSLFALAGLEKDITSVIGDIRDFEKLNEVFEKYQPQVVLHLAAQPIVRESYRSPRYTYETNVMGTVNLCECVRLHDCVESFLNVTTDKVYHNNEWAWGYREDEPLDGFDPYSNSKSCSELVTHAYINSFFGGNKVRGSGDRRSASVPCLTARAGNVIGGGDFAADRIIPDCVRAAEAGVPIEIRNPNSTRPYQHVLEPLFAYLMIAARQAEDIRYAGFYNVGPDECDCVTTGDLVQLFGKYWGDGFSSVICQDLDAPHEANFLKLDCSKLKSVFGWQPTWHIDEAIEKTVEWSKAYLDAKGACSRSKEDASGRSKAMSEADSRALTSSVREVMDRQILEYAQASGTKNSFRSC